MSCIIDERIRLQRVVQRLGGGRGCNKLVPVLRGDGTKIASPRDLCDQLPGERN